MKGETFYEGDNPLSYADEDHRVDGMMEQEKKFQEDENHGDMTTDFEGLPLYMVCDIQYIVDCAVHHELLY